MDLLALAGAAQPLAAAAQAEAAAGETAFQINLFWVLTQAASFVLFLVIVYLAAFRRIGGVLEERRSRIEQGLKDADAARKEREAAADERRQVLTKARREAAEIVARAEQAGEELRERQVGEVRTELDRMKAQAREEIEAERARALADVRSQVADLALVAAAKVVGESMDGPRQRRLVDEFLAEVGSRRNGR